MRQLHLPVEPDQRLLALEDPYDPTQNAPYRIHDASLYQDRYYLYFGVGPVALLLLPWYVVSGTFLPHAHATALFLIAAFVASVAILVFFRARHWPGSSLILLGCSALALGLGGAWLHLAQSNDFYPVPIACGSACVFVGLYCLLRADEHGRAEWEWLLLGSLAFGGAIASRPNLILAATVLGWPILHAFWRAWRRECTWQHALGMGIAASAPVILCGLALLWHNWARFDAPLEFGMRYQLAGEKFIEKEFVSWDFVFTHAREYLWSTATWSRYFPFFEPAEARPYGVMRVYPWLWVCLGLPLAVLVAQTRGTLVYRLGMVGWVAASSAVMVFSFFGVTHRYYGDFLPFLFLLAGLVAIGIDHFAQGGTSRLWRAVSWVLVAFTISVNALVAAQKFSRPEQLERVAGLLNRPAYLWEQARGQRLGPVQLRVRFPAPTPGSQEPLLSTGNHQIGGDIIYVRYLEGNRLQFGAFHPGLGGPEGNPVPYEPGKTYTIEIAAGGLYPLAGHLAYRKWREAEVDRLRRELQVRLDGQLVLSGEMAYYPVPPGHLAVGRNNVTTDVTTKEFAGTIEQVERLPLRKPAPLRREQQITGPQRLQLRFPGFRTGKREPILATGNTKRGDMLWVEYLTDNQVRFGFEHAGRGSTVSDALPLGSGEWQTLDVSLGVLSAERAESLGKDTLVSSRLYVRMNDDVVFDTTLPMHAVAPDTAVLGYNSLKSPSVEGIWFAELKERQSFDLPAPPRLTTGGDVEMTVLFPRDVMTAIEPLVTTGIQGAGDFLFVRYVDEHHVVFGFDHWGVFAAESEPVRIEYDQPQSLRLRMPSLRSPAQPTDPSAKQVEVWLNGTSVFRAESGGHPTTPEQLTVGENRIGGSSARARFSGTILRFGLAAGEP